MSEAVGNVKKAVIRVSKKEAAELQAILDIESGYYDGCDRDGTIQTFTADFGDGMEADIKVCNGDTPYVDAVLFQDGSEVHVLEVDETLLGEYEFEHEGTEYHVLVTDEEEATDRSAEPDIDVDFVPESKNSLLQFCAEHYLPKAAL